MNYTYYYNNEYDIYANSAYANKNKETYSVEDEFKENKETVLKLVNYMKINRADTKVLTLYNKPDEDQKQLCENMVFGSANEYKDDLEIKPSAYSPTIIVRSGSQIVGIMLMDRQTRNDQVVNLLWEICAVKGYGKHCMLIAEHVLFTFFPEILIITLYCVEDGIAGPLHTFYENCNYIKDDKARELYKGDNKGMYYKEYDKGYMVEIAQLISDQKITLDTPNFFQTMVTDGQLTAQPIPSKFVWPQPLKITLKSVLKTCIGQCIGSSVGGSSKKYIKYNNIIYLVREHDNKKYIKSRLQGEIHLATIKNRYRYVQR